MFQAPGPHISEITFLKLNKTIWPPPDSSVASSSSASSFTSSSFRSSQALSPSVDSRSWPFSFALPATFTHHREDYPLPPTYADKAYITYMIHVVLKRDFLHSDIRWVEHAPVLGMDLFKLILDHHHHRTSVSTTFRYVPRIRPQDPSELYSRALLQGTPIPGEPHTWDPSIHYTKAKGTD